MNIINTQDGFYVAAFAERIRRPAVPRSYIIPGNFGILARNKGLAK